MVFLNNSIGLVPTTVMLFIWNEPPKWHQRFRDATSEQYVGLAFSCVVGILIGWTAVNCQRFISATSFMVLGNTQRVFVWVYGMAVLDDAHGALSIAGAIVALLGGLYYGWARLELSEKAKASSANEMGETGPSEKNEEAEQVARAPKKPASETTLLLRGHGAVPDRPAP